MVLNGDDAEIKEISERLNVDAKKTNLTASFYIADKNEILFMINKSDENQEQTAVWFSSPFFVNSFVGLVDIALKNK